jgi:hypothetical protein
MMKALKILTLLFSVFSASLSGAQTDPPEPILDTDISISVSPAMAEGQKFMFISAELEHGGKVIQGAPYRAVAVTERAQTLADGNRILENSSADIYRDREGRTRREMKMNAIGAWEASEEAPRRVFINDPVAKVHYVLEPENQIARKMEIQSEWLEKVPQKGQQFERRIIGHPPHGAFSAAEIVRYKISDKDAKKESLGKRTMEGISVEGTRTTITIPAGQMGNEMPIQIVSERWYSPELQIDVMTKHNDPRLGETVYRLTEIRRGEQDHSLFQVPKSYKIEDAAVRHKIIHRKKD